ncbi:MAG: HlyD family secretion protein [Chitinophagaceae bacterium]
MQEVADKKKKMGSRKLAIIVILSIVIIIFGIRTIIHSAHHETTENAQLDASVISVRSAVSGYVIDVKVKENQFVKKGDTIVIIDSIDYKAKVMQAKAMLRNAEAQTGISRSAAMAAMQNASASSMSSSVMKFAIVSAKAKAEKAQKEFNRIEKMYNDGAASQQQLDAVKSEWQSTNAQLDMAEKQFQASTMQASGTKSSAASQEGQVSVATALVQQRVAELQLAEIQLTHTVVVAPYDGIVSKKAIEIGQLIQISQPICSIVSTGDLWVVANFKETQLKSIKPGEHVSIKVDAYPDKKLKGVVESLGAATGSRFALIPPDNATGNFVKVTQRVPVRIKLEGVDNKDHQLAPGLSAFVDVEIE